MFEADRFLQKMAGCGVQEVTVGGRRLRRGSRVRLKPRPGGDILDQALAGQTAVIDGIDEDEGGAAHVAVVLQDDPGWDLGGAKHPARRFFFAPEELEPLPGGEGTQRRVLVAGIGNIFFGDDGFGVAVAQRLLEQPLPAGIEVADFGIRGMDLAYALGRPYQAAILVDAIPRGAPPGSLHLIAPDGDHGDAAPLNPHGMDPLAVLQLARRLGELPPQLLLLGCEPAAIPAEKDPESLAMGLSPPVAAAVEEAAEMVVKLAGRLLAGRVGNQAEKGVGP